MPHDVIHHHEHWQYKPLREFLTPFWRQGQGIEVPLPEFTEARGTANAQVNHGRWIVSCPAGCGGAMVVSVQEPFYICYECGSQENSGQWYNVVYPRTKAAIESTLLQRPVPFNRFFHAENRNWLPGETLTKLRADNEAQGIS